MDAADVNPWGKQDKKSRSSSKSGKFTKKMSQKFKVAAVSGAKKIKSGASAGVNWLKIKYDAHKLAKKK